MIGTSLNQYRIAASIGAGGIGEVLRARDSRLNRDVAIKVLPKDFVSDADRLRRFEQEAKTLAHERGVERRAACSRRNQLKRSSRTRTDRPPLPREAAGQPMVTDALPSL